MRNRLGAAYPDAFIITKDVPIIYVADFSERTDSIRKVEVHNVMPECPHDKDKVMDCLIIVNPSSIKLDFNIFDDHQFIDKEGKDIEHCEGCFYPYENNDDSWITLLEIKDCKPKNVSVYREKVISQIISSAELLRNRNIITTHKVYGVVSMPRTKTSFNSTIFGMPPDYTSLKRKHNILFAATNKIEIVDNKKIKFTE